MVKEVLKKEVPERVQSAPEFRTFLQWVEENNIRNRKQLSRVLDEEIQSYQEKLNKRMKDMREGTNSRLTRDYSRRLKFLKTCRSRICKYL